MKILITGGAGFIGGWIVERLPASVEVVVVDLLEPEVHRRGRAFTAAAMARARCLKADVCVSESWEQELDGADVVIHLAANTGVGQSMDQPGRYVRTNTEGTARLLEAIARAKRPPSRLVLASSRAVYGDGWYRATSGELVSGRRSPANLAAGRFDVLGPDGTPLEPVAMSEETPPQPVSVYGFTKLWQEDLVRLVGPKIGLESVILRLQNVYGPRQEAGNPYTGIVAMFMQRAACGETIEIYEDGRPLRDFVFVEDVADMLVKAALDRSVPPGVVDVGTGVATSLLDLCAAIGDVVGVTPRLHLGGTYRLGDVRHAVADLAGCRAFFGATPRVDLRTGLARYWDWMREEQPRFRQGG